MSCCSRRLSRRPLATEAALVCFVLSIAGEAAGDAPAWMVVAAANASQFFGPYFGGAVSPKIGALGRLGREWMLGGNASFGVLSAGTGFGESGSPRLFHAMAELRWLPTHDPNANAGVWLAIDLGVGGSYTTGVCDTCLRPESSVVAGPSAAFLWGGAWRVGGRTWFELAGVLYAEYFAGSSYSASYPWVELGIELGLRYAGPL